MLSGWFIVAWANGCLFIRDLVEGYLFPDAGGKRKIDQHLALGVSLGGHSVWQLMFAEPRVTAGVVVIGCPDYMSEWLPPTLVEYVRPNGYRPPVGPREAV